MAGVSFHVMSISPVWVYSLFPHQEQNLTSLGFLCHLGTYQQQHTKPCSWDL